LRFAILGNSTERLVELSYIQPGFQSAIRLWTVST
jgi:hypothetical protein